MLTITRVDLAYWFYPTGNTPAVNLLRDVHPVKGDKLKILSLACGDVRNILFSLSSLYEHGQNAHIQMTCCDYEPAVLARNIFLFTFVLNGLSAEQLTSLWDLYYHLFIPRKDLDQLKEHATHLMNVSATMEDWRTSSYGQHLKFLNANTLRRVRAFWQLYALSDNSNDAVVREAIKSNWAKHHGGTWAGGLGGHRSTGLHSVSSMFAMRGALKTFWDSGVVAGNSGDLAVLTSEHGGRVNPMLSLSSAPNGHFAVHYSTDPLLGFHLAEVFDQPKSELKTLEGLARLAKSQFHSWCRGLARLMERDSVEILFHFGEAINFCHELQGFCCEQPTMVKSARSYVKPLSAEPLVLDFPEDARRINEPYDVIDTSNLIDHAGPLNLIPAAAPLLSRAPQSVMYTETLILASHDTSKTLVELLHADLTAFSLLIGLTPHGHLLGFTTDSFDSEVAWHAIDSGSVGFRMRIPWRSLHATVASPKDKARGRGVRIDQSQLAMFFTRCYVGMFAANENLDLRMAQMPNAEGILSPRERFTYSRITLVALLNAVKKNISTDWDACVGQLVQNIETNRSLILSSNYLQELCVHLHLSGLWQVPVFTENPRHTVTQFGAPRDTQAEPGLLGSLRLPGLAQIVLVVPRTKLAVFTNRDPSRIGSPGFHIAVSNTMKFQNCFFGLDAFFGRLVGAADSATRSIAEDSSGWEGSSDLIVTCKTPLFPFLVGARSATRVSLTLEPSIQNTLLYAEELGFMLQVFSACLDDADNLLLLREAPAVMGTTSVRSNARIESQVFQSPSTGTVDMLSASLTAECAVATLCIRTHFTDTEHSRALLLGANVAIIPTSACTLDIRFGSVIRTLHFPHPVDGSRCKTRIARKQSWIEIIAAPSPFLHAGGYDIDPFPVVRSQNGQLVAWGMGRVNLNHETLIGPAAKLEMLNPHLGSTMSQAEREIHQKHNEGTTSTKTLVDLKQSIASLVLGVAKQHPSAPGQSHKRFAFVTDHDSDTLLFVKAVCHDRDTGSVVLDAFMLPLSKPRIKLFPAGSVQAYNRNGRDIEIEFSREEEILWKRIMPAFVERCRFTWNHTDKCEYIHHGSTVHSADSAADGFPHQKIPLSVDHGRSPICSCGEGKDAADCPAEFSDFAKYATRVAIAPISAVPYVESMAPTEMDFAETKLAGTSLVTTTGDVCGHCKTAKAGPKACARCGDVKYCNHACQKAAWKEHKKVCKK